MPECVTLGFVISSMINNVGMLLVGKILSVVIVERNRDNYERATVIMMIYCAIALVTSFCINQSEIKNDDSSKSKKLKVE